MTTGRALLHTLRRLPTDWTRRGLATLGVLAATTLTCSWVSDAIGLATGGGDVFLTASVPQLDESTEVVLLGSSHIFANIDAGALSRPAVSLSVPSANIWHEADFARVALNRCPNLKLVVVEISGVNLLPRAERRDEFEAEKQSQLAIATGETGDSIVDSISRWPVVDSLANRATMNVEWIKSHLETGGLQRDLRPGFHGFQADPDKYVGDGTYARAYSEMHADEPEEGLDTLRQLIAELRGRGVRAVLLRTPHHPTYREAEADFLAAAPDRAAAAVDAPFWDDFTREYPQPQWFDEHHLNVVGAADYTQLIDERIESLLAVDSLLDATSF